MVEKQCVYIEPKTSNKLDINSYNNILVNIFFLYVVFVVYRSRHLTAWCLMFSYNSIVIDEVINVVNTRN